MKLVSRARRFFGSLNKRQRVVVLSVTALVLAAVMLALIVGAVRPRVNKSAFRVYFDEKKIVAYNNTVRDGVVYINAFDLAQYCELSVSGDTSRLRLYASEGEYADFVPGSAVVSLGGMKVVMPGAAYYDHGALWIPCEFVNSNFNSVSIVVDTEHNKLSVWRDEAEGSTTASPRYRTVTFLRSGTAPGPSDTVPSDTTGGKTEDIDVMISEYTYQTDISAFKKYLDPRDPAMLVLANKSKKLGAEYTPGSLVTLDASLTIYGGVKQLESTAAGALAALMQEMRAAGYTDVFVTSAYRDYAYQSALFSTYISREMASDSSLSYEQARQKVLEYSAEPGTSEHQTGLCVDFIVTGMTDLDETFATKPVYSWLCDNAYKFGFILRYPQDKVAITGYSYEPWHYRFVGQQAAAEMRMSGECLEEYLGG